MAQDVSATADSANPVQISAANGQPAENHLDAATADQTQAGDIETSQSEPAQIEVMTVIASRSERPLREVANSVSIIEADRIQETLIGDIKDFARYTPWLSVSNDPSRFGAAGFSIRGIESNRVATEIDGVPVADGFSIGSYSSARRDLVGPAMLKRMEVLRGPASALYGSDAIGGVVSYTTWQPGDLLLNTHRDWSLRFSTGYRSRDNSLSNAISAAAGGEHVSGLLIAAFDNGSELDNSARHAGSRPNPRDYDKTDILARLVKTEPTGSTAVTVEFRDTGARTEVNNLEGQGRFASTSYLAGDDRQTRKRITLDGQFESAISFADDVTWQVYYQQSETDQYTVEERVASRRSPSPTRRYPSFHFSDTTLGTNLSATREIQQDSVTHRVLYGVQFTRSQVEEYRNNRLVNLDDGSQSATVLGETFPLRDFPVSRILNAALFAHDEIQMADERLILIPAIRIEYYDLDPRADEIYLEDNPLTSVVSITELSVSPKLGLVYHLSDQTSVFAQYARGFRSAPFEDANIGLEIPLFNIRAIPNPDLRPETSDGIELGLRHLRDRFAGSVSVFANDYEDFIDSKVNLGPDSETGVLTFQSLNRDRARIYGAEVEVSYQLDDLLPGLAVSGNAALTRGKDRSRSQPLNTVDPDRAVFSLRYDNPGQNWGAELLASMATAKTRVDESSFDYFKPPGYGTLDLIGYLRLSGKTTVNLGVFNLTDKRYWDWSDVRGRPADDPLIDLYTRPGLNISANLRMEW